MKRQLIALLLALTFSGMAAFADDAAAEYTRVLTQRAEKIVAPLNFSDATKAEKVRDIIVQQYRDLAAIHDARDQQIAEAKAKAGPEKAEVDRATQTVRDETKTRLDKLHEAFLAHLGGELSPEQIDQVKDGLTYGVLQVTYDAYMKSFPNLTAEQKKQIKDWLTEARELAMDQGSSHEKHAVFGKYKGRINNYLVKAGYDLKEGERNLRASMNKSSDSK